jgi:hypothetical protein
VAFLNWGFGLTQMTAWRIEVAPFPDLSSVDTPTKPIITIPMSIYGYGNGDDAEEGGAKPYLDDLSGQPPRFITSVGAAFSWCTRPPRLAKCKGVSLWHFAKESRNDVTGGSIGSANATKRDAGPRS